jgi:hypothetical protein
MNKLLAGLAVHDFDPAAVTAHPDNDFQPTDSTS